MLEASNYSIPSAIAHIKRLLATLKDYDFYSQRLGKDHQDLETLLNVPSKIANEAIGDIIATIDKNDSHLLGVAKRAKQAIERISKWPKNRLRNAQRLITEATEAFREFEIEIHKTVKTLPPSPSS